MENEIAILMAAGLGSRMAPLTEKIPKPLVKVHGISMIESVICGLQSRGISHIYVVVGYKKEKFEFLKNKYNNLSLIDNTEFQIKNNISSIYSVCDIMGSKHCFICESDLYVTDFSIFRKQFHQSCYYGKMFKGHSDDWVFDLNKEGRIIRVGKTGNNTYNMCGIAYFFHNDAKKIAEAVKEAYKRPGHEQLFWDDIVNEQLGNINPIEDSQIIEIDTIDELAAVAPDYLEYNEVSDL